ncbi:hypothetical protein, partial [Mycolicibacterium insubricum]|uniref:hypothetical protein n=1 Tax=Mycolicibacterium insubricum TaxID=444597 RepID=UPI0021F363B2
SVRPEPGSNSPNKNPHTTVQARFSIRKNDHKQKTPKTGIQKKQPHPKREKECGQKTTNKNQPNTLLSSQTTGRDSTEGFSASRL